MPLVISFFFALLALLSQLTTGDLVWSTNSFLQAPVIAASGTTNASFLQNNVVLIRGDISSGQNYLGATTSNSDGTYNFFLRAMNATSLQINGSDIPISTKLPSNNFKYTSTSTGYFALALVDIDEFLYSQIYIYYLLTNATVFRKIALTANQDYSVTYSISDVFNNEEMILVAYDEGEILNGTFEGFSFNLNSMTLVNHSVNNPIQMAIADTDTSGLCDALPYTGSAYCIWKSNGIVYSAEVNLTNSTVGTVQTLFTDDTVAGVVYSTSDVLAAQGYYVGLVDKAEATNDHVMAVFSNSDAAGVTLKTLATTTAQMKITVRSMFSFYAGFGAAYSTVNADETLTWSYQTYLRDGSSNGTEVMIATVTTDYPGSTFLTTEMFARRSLMVLGSQSDSAGVTPYLWYGMLLNQTMNAAIYLKFSLVFCVFALFCMFNY